MSGGDPIRITHIIAGLNVGGAETMLLKLLSATDRARFAPRVISISDVGPIGEKIRALGIPVDALGLKMGRPDPRTPGRIARVLRQTKTEIVQTWMYHADLVGGLGAWLAGRIPVAWNIRQSNFKPGMNRRATVLAARVCAMLSGFVPARIVCVSEATRETHIAMGYAARKMQVIGNGFDIAAFRPDPAARIAVRAELKIPAEAPIIGLVGRFDPMKDHANFVRAAGLLAGEIPGVQFVLCGRDVVRENAELAGWIDAAGIGASTHLLGQRADVARLTAAFDIAASSSASEGFSNAIGEAMACGVPCVVTDVGDSARVVGDTGRVVPAHDSPALAAAFQAVLRLSRAERTALGMAARARVESHFSLPVIAAQYAELHAELAAKLRRRHSR